MYTGLTLVAEYVSLLGPKINKGFMTMVLKPGTVPRIAVTEEGSIIIGTDLDITTFDKYHYKAPGYNYSESTFSFVGCDEQIHLIDYPSRSRFDNRPTATNHIVSMGIQSKDDLGFGILSVCKEHTKYCHGANQQYHSEEECLNFMNKLPVYSPKCGLQSAASGNSTLCRIKHQV